jgi:hypothetical protein
MTQADLKVLNQQFPRINSVSDGKRRETWTFLNLGNDGKRDGTPGTFQNLDASLAVWVRNLCGLR